MTLTANEVSLSSEHWRVSGTACLILYFINHTKGLPNISGKNLGYVRCILPRSTATPLLLVTCNGAREVDLFLYINENVLEWVIRLRCQAG